MLYNGAMKMNVRGIPGLVPLPQPTVTDMYYNNGAERTVVHGMSKPLVWAAAEGRFDVVQWCHNHGCPWDTWTCSNAARNGHLHIYYNGLEPMVVRGIDGRASKPHNRDTGTLYNGLKKMAVHHHHRNEDDVFFECGEKCMTSNPKISNKERQ